MRYSVSNILLGAVCILVTPLAMAIDPHFYGITTPANVVGERRTWAIVDLKGAPASNVDVYVSYGTSSSAATTSGSTATYSDARCSPYGTGKLRCYVIFPHGSKSSGWNPYDKNPRKIAPGSRTYFRWAKEVRPSGSTSAITINDSVRSFIMPRRLTIGVFGDSYASGEGAPYIRSGYSRWLAEEGCHRSRYSGHRLGVYDFIRANPGIDVHWRFYACSGAEVLNGILERQTNDNGSRPTLYSQMDWHKRWIRGYGYPRLDVAVISIGGNDMGFVDVGVECLLNNLRGGCNRSAAINNFINSHLAMLYRVGSDGRKYGWYTELDQELKSELGVRKVILSEYPDVSRDANERFCNLPLLAYRVDCVGAAELTMSQDESSWVYQNVLVRLNRKVKEAANGLGWVVAGDSRISSSGALGNTSGNMARSRKRGLCNCDYGYFNTFRQALLKYQDHHATWHPNRRGFHYTYRRTIYAALQQQVRSTSFRREYPTLVMSTSITTRGVDDDLGSDPVAYAEINERAQGEFIDEYPGDEVMSRAAGGEKGPPEDVIDQKEDITGAGKVKQKVKELDPEEEDYAAVEGSEEPRDEKPGRADPAAVKRAEMAEKERGPKEFKKRTDWGDIPPNRRKEMEKHQADKQTMFAEIEKLKGGPPEKGKGKQ